MEKSNPQQTHSDGDTAKSTGQSEYAQVRQLFLDCDGRLRQQTIVQETAWCETKVSQVVSRLAENEQIEKIRIGRENLLQITETDPQDNSQNSSQTQ